MNVILKNHFFGFNVVKQLIESLEGNGIICNRLMTVVHGRQQDGSRMACDEGKSDERSGYWI